MRITADTNLLVRVATQDDIRQARLAAHLLSRAEIVAIPLSALCEFCWVLRAIYAFNNGEIRRALRRLSDAPNVVLDRSAVDAGLQTLASGGDFADGAIAYEGARLGGDTFYSFDKQAVAQLKSVGMAARLLA